VSATKKRKQSGLQEEPGDAKWSQGIANRRGRKGAQEGGSLPHIFGGRALQKGPAPRPRKKNVSRGGGGVGGGGFVRGGGVWWGGFFLVGVWGGGGGWWGGGGFLLVKGEKACSTQTPVAVNKE